MLKNWDGFSVANTLYPLPTLRCVGIKCVTPFVAWLLLSSLHISHSLIILFASFFKCFPTCIHKNIFKNMSIILWDCSSFIWNIKLASTCSSVIFRLSFTISHLFFSLLNRAFQDLSRLLFRTLAHFALIQAVSLQGVQKTPAKTRMCWEMRHERSHELQSQNLLIYRPTEMLDSSCHWRSAKCVFVCLCAKSRFARMEKNAGE